MWVYSYFRKVRPFPAALLYQERKSTATNLSITNCLLYPDSGRGLVHHPLPLLTALMPAHALPVVQTRFGDGPTIIRSTLPLLGTLLHCLGQAQALALGRCLIRSILRVHDGVWKISRLSSRDPEMPPRSRRAGTSTMIPSNSTSNAFVRLCTSSPSHLHPEECS